MINGVWFLVIWKQFTSGIESKFHTNIYNYRDLFGVLILFYISIYSFFSTSLRDCLLRTEMLGPLIKKSEDKMYEMYVKYCLNKTLSEHIVKEHFDYFEMIRVKLSHALTVWQSILLMHAVKLSIFSFIQSIFPHNQLQDLLIKPVQRIMKYELLLRDMLKHSERAELVDEISDLQEAIRIINVNYF